MTAATLPRRRPGEAYADAFVETFVDIHGLPSPRYRCWVPVGSDGGGVFGGNLANPLEVEGWAAVLGATVGHDVLTRACDVDPDLLLVVRRTYITVHRWIPFGGGITLHLLYSDTAPAGKFGRAAS